MELKSIRINQNYSTVNIYNEFNKKIIKEIEKAIKIDSSKMNDTLPKYREIKSIIR
ncbi:hypothetical protein DFH43_000090 [Clostridium beijerinckii]|nr:hypothetical protein [Clostridium beijerinckii]